MKQFLCLLVLLLTITAYPQRGNNWVFGSKAHINFSTTPVSTGTSAMSQLEGSSSISDINGNLLFYSDGVTVWNALHQVMPNGTGLKGHFSSTQSSMIVPFPADPLRYYVFTMSAVGHNDGLQYSVVNMALDNGKGDVETKNTYLIGPATEKLTSVNHCNGKDVWVVTAQKNSDKFYAYLVTATGIQPPVISPVGVPASYFTIGYLKFSPDGTMLACANMQAGLDLYSFDVSTGLISNRKRVISGSQHSPYGVEFSPNSKLLYVSDVVRFNPTDLRFDISQYGSLDGNEASIAATKYEMANMIIPNAPMGMAYFNALQLGPDERIYVSTMGGGALMLISKPDRPGAACMYGGSFPLAAGTGCTFGLPDFNQSYFKGTFDFDVSCTNNEVKFYFTTPAGATGIRWNFGDPASGANNFSTIDSPIHVFTNAGLYDIMLVVQMPCRNDTIRKQIMAGPLMANLGPDKNICGTAPVLLTPEVQGIANSFLWQDNSTLSTFTASSSGIYWVEIRNNQSNCVHRDSIMVTLTPYPVVDLGDDITICENTSTTLDAGNPGALYTWQDNSTNQTLTVSQAGEYHVRVDLNSCLAYDTILVSVKMLPKIQFGNDTAICNGMTIRLAPGINDVDNTQLTWSTGDSSPSIDITQPGDYSLTAINTCGTTTESITVKPGVCKVYVPTAFTPNHDGRNDVFKIGYGENITTFTMQVYNRWGERIFLSNQPSRGWDGKIKGQTAPIGIYVWIIHYRLADSPVEYVLKGTVALVL